MRRSSCPSRDFPGRPFSTTTGFPDVQDDATGLAWTGSEFADSVASDEASYVTGAEWSVDGGATAGDRSLLG